MSRAERYTLASTHEERARLARQAARIRPATERLFRAAGIGPGARVLDVGSGAGDVAMLAAELVGPSGAVVGIDRDRAQLDTAAARCEAAGLAHVRFEVGDLHEPPAGPFDAIVGRLVLMYQPDPAVALRSLAGSLPSGGVMAFMEMSNPPPGQGFGATSWPQHELVPAIGSWIARAFAVTGVQPLLGLRLRGAYRAAGLEPQDPVEAISIVYVGRESAEMAAGLVRSMLPVLVEHGIATAEEVDIDTLADRIVAAAGDQELVGAVGPIVAAWARKP